MQTFSFELSKDDGKEEQKIGGRRPDPLCQGYIMGKADRTAGYWLHKRSWPTAAISIC